MLEQFKAALIQCVNFIVCIRHQCFLLVLNRSFSTKKLRRAKWPGALQNGEHLQFIPISILCSADGAEMGRAEVTSHPEFPGGSQTCFSPGYHHLCTFSTMSAAVLLVVSRFSTNAVSPRKFPDADDSRESKLSSKVFKVILNPFCCVVRSDCKQ